MALFRLFTIPCRGNGGKSWRRRLHKESGASSEAEEFASKRAFAQALCAEFIARMPSKPQIQDSADHGCAGEDKAAVFF